MRSAIVRAVVLAILLLILALIVPSSTPVSIGESLPVGPFRLTAYGACVAAGALLAALFVVWLGKRRNLRLNVALDGLLCGAAGALLGARLLYCAVMIESIAIDFGLAFIPRLWEGGYTLFGGVAGGLAGLALYARIGKKPLKPLLDVMAPGAALFLAIIRLGECFTTQGLGFFVDDAALQWFPLAVRDVYGYWAAPVFFYEALAALLTAALCVVMLFRGKPGMSAVWFLALLSLSQIMLDSWRHDEYLRFGFVHVNQLAAVAVLGMLLAASVWRRVRQSGWNAWQVVRPVLFAALIGVLIWIEFALDKSNIDNAVLYAVMTVALIGMGFAVLRGGRPLRDRKG
ncbi:MAG: prolipoprotein diacylglyceryl transferase [Clostridiales bacterium]|nr:prolipoprotein diacylglyceryl transferase [Clostridiales bacterium]